jgi:tRNA(adenine34) deaminase
MFSARDFYWMQHAIDLAKQAEKAAEVPVGAVLIRDDKIVGEGWNRPIKECDPSAHAEIMALRQGAKNLNNYRLINTTLYVTLEPCLMCLGAIVQGRLQRVVFGAYDKRAGAVESAFQLGITDKLNHRVKYEGGLLMEECARLLSNFFQARR